MKTKTFIKEMKALGIIKVRTKKHHIYNNPANPLPHPIVLHDNKDIKEIYVIEHRKNIRNWKWGKYE